MLLKTVMHNLAFHLSHDGFDGHGSVPPEQRWDVGNFEGGGNHGVEHSKERVINVLVRQEVVLVALECCVDHFDGRWRCERSVRRRRSQIDMNHERVGLEKAVDGWGHDESRPSLCTALGALE
jgi:hypothetical protein